jgi:hypothetical protein
MGLLYMLTLWSNVCIIWALNPMIVLWPAQPERVVIIGWISLAVWPPEVRFGHAASIIYNSIQYSGHRCCIIGLLG